MLESYKVHKKGTRKFKCNPPTEFDVQQYVSENRVAIEWIDWLIIKIDPTIAKDLHYLLQDKKVTIFYDENTLSQFIESVNKQLNPDMQFPHGSTAPGRFYFSPDWLGIE